MENKSFIEKLLDFLSSNKKETTKQFSNTEIILHNNVIYPNNKEKRELDTLLGEIRTMHEEYEQSKIKQNEYATKEHMISDAYKKFTINKNINKYNSRKSSKQLETNLVKRTVTPYVSEKQKYKELERNFDNLLSSGKNIFKEDDFAN